VFGLLANASARFAFEFPFLAALSNLNFRAETSAISLIEKTPFIKMRNMIMMIVMIKCKCPGKLLPDQFLIKQVIIASQVRSSQEGINTKL
jgi:hypothetical protein